ncbi:uncharacterized protein DSM5745_03553 [Aspergillus mulundensis]|uniref:Uncharacterized protein n=1 Tax=Aspergillus mulundensis TaxID=1810919 RepID=A0A3D8SL47_9EURO|nr:hypothetical protein DSM5745_03553 [Aspergillus mulundensis]RDW86911.1 hypothetical protein DSM5745_03553 [Aspergillus mulundensis]
MECRNYGSSPGSRSLEITGHRAPRLRPPVKRWPVDRSMYALMLKLESSAEASPAKLRDHGCYIADYIIASQESQPQYSQSVKLIVRHVNYLPSVASATKWIMVDTHVVFERLQQNYTITNPLTEGPSTAFQARESPPSRVQENGRLIASLSPQPREGDKFLLADKNSIVATEDPYLQRQQVTTAPSLNYNPIAAEERNPEPRWKIR